MQTYEYPYRWRNAHVIVIGLGVNGGGVGTVRYLLNQGASVTVTDLKSAERLQDSIEQINTCTGGARVLFRLGTNEVSELESADYVVKSPAVPQTAQLIKQAHAYQIPVLTDVDIFFRELHARYSTAKRPLVVGVTGTRGKSTTTSLIYEIVRAGGFHVVLGGNIGTSVLDLLSEITAQIVVVLELSSFQLETLTVSPHIGVVTNLFPDHLDRHGTMEAYRAAKANIVRYQSEEDWAILNAEQDRVRSMAEETIAHVRYYSIYEVEPPAPREAWIDTEGYIHTSSSRDPICHTSDVALRGTHNLKNILAALSVAEILEVPADSQAHVVRTFKGLPNRLEVVGTYRGVTYVNDTTSTMPEATLAALSVFSERPIHLIAGGQSKNVSYQELINKIPESTVQTIMLLPGTASEMLRNNLILTEHQELHMVDELATAVNLAQQKASSQDVVLFSPAATSFASFENEFDRGNAFREIVQKIAY